MKHLIFLSFVVLLLASCKKHDCVPPPNNTSNYIVFGHFYGECVGESCIETFKLDSVQVWEDTLDKYLNAQNGSDFKDLSFVPLPAQKFELVKDLPNFFPNQLLSDPVRVFGQPDAADGGGLYVEYHRNGINKLWLFDQSKSNVPVQYHAFMDKINQKIGLLQ